MRFSWLPGFRSRPGGTVGEPGWRGMDYHCHLLPGVDDGVASFGEAREVIEALEGLGFAGAVVTPHIYRGVFDNDAAGLRAVFAAFRGQLAAEGVNFKLRLAAEYFADKHLIGLIERDELLWLAVGGERWVLLEFPYVDEPLCTEACLVALRARGYRPVVAHVERYRFVADDPVAWLGVFEQAGAVLQGDIGSLAGQYGEAVKIFARWLLERGKITVWGSDVHRLAQVSRHLVPGLALLRNRKPNAILDGVAVAEAA